MNALFLNALASLCLSLLIHINILENKLKVDKLIPDYQQYRIAIILFVFLLFAFLIGFFTEVFFEKENEAFRKWKQDKRRSDNRQK
ncbi:MAG: hypothetical protein HC867_01585 [Bacteroidia bacterium]|nr:hypothetical protein [Bacteroidia bacterium]